MSTEHPVGAAGVPPVPNSNENQKPDVVAGLDPPTEACIIRPNMEALGNFGSGLADDWPTASKLIHTAYHYILHLERQVSNCQNQNNLSLTTLRAERDALRTKLDGVKRDLLLLPKKIGKETLDDYTEDELKELGEEQENYYTLESLCCKHAISVSCELSEFAGRANYVADASDMAEALIEAKRNQAEMAELRAQRDALTAHTPSNP